MKEFISSKTYFSTMIIAIFFCCFNGSVVDTNSTTTSMAPDANFYGTLEDHYRTAQIESILIGGKYESIPVYQDVLKSMTDKKEKIAGETIDPKQNKILLNLKDIKSIALKHPENLTTSSILVNSKSYIQIIVTSISGTKREFLIESTRRITCKERDKGSEKHDATILQDRDLNFTHIKKLTINGYKSDEKSNLKPDEESLGRPSDSMNSQQQKNKFKTDTAQILHSIEENIKNLPLDNPTAFETMRETVLLLLKSLRDQLQNFLDMVK